jgi:hypothetical protein
VDANEGQIVEWATTLRVHQGGSQSTIVEIKIEFLTCSNVSWIVLCQAFKELPKLKRILLRQVRVVRNNQDDDEDDENMSLPEILSSNVLNHCPNIEELHLVDCGLNSMVAQALARQLPARVRATQSNPSLSGLKVLSLEGNSIGNVGVKCISNALEHNNSLVALDIDRIGCCFDGIHALSKSLKQNGRLASLSCFDNGGLERFRRPPTSSAATAPTSNIKFVHGSTQVHGQQPRFDHLFEDLLSVNTTLKRIQPRAYITPAIDYYLRLNRAGRRYLGDAYVTERLLHLVLGPVSNDVDVLYYFLHAWSGYCQA